MRKRIRNTSGTGKKPDGIWWIAGTAVGRKESDQRDDRLENRSARAREMIRVEATDITKGRHRGPGDVADAER